MTILLMWDFRCITFSANFKRWAVRTFFSKRYLFFTNPWNKHLSTLEHNSKFLHIYMSYQIFFIGIVRNSPESNQHVENRRTYIWKPTDLFVEWYSYVLYSTNIMKSSRHQWPLLSFLRYTHILNTTASKTDSIIFFQRKWSSFFANYILTSFNWTNARKREYGSWRCYIYASCETERKNNIYFRNSYTYVHVNDTFFIQNLNNTSLVLYFLVIFEVLFENLIHHTTWLDSRHLSN